MDMTNEEYSRYVAGMAKPSPLWKDLIWAFLVGGLICTLGQGLSDLYQSWGLDKTDAGTAVSVTLIFLSAFSPPWGGLTSWPSTLERVLWYPSPALPMRWPLPLWSSKARDWCWG